MAGKKILENYRGFDDGLSYLTGVSDLNPWALRAMTRPHTYTGPNFWVFYNDTIELIKEYLHTKATLIPIPGPGRVVMDAALNNFFEPGDRMLMIDNGYWGRYPEVMAQTYGIKLVPLVIPIQRPVDPQAVEEKLKSEKNIKAVHVMHVETETGIINPVKQIGEVVRRLAPNVLYIVDSATAFPGNPIDFDKWGIDVGYFVSHKGFNGPSGLNYLIVNDRAMKAFRNRSKPPQAWYTSIQTWLDIWLENTNDGRHCLESFPNVILQAMRAKLDLMNELGEERYLKKYELASRAIRMGVRKMTEPADMLIGAGPRCQGCPGCEAPDPSLTLDGKGRFCAQTDVSIAYPKNTDWKKIVEVIQERYWITCPHFGFGDERKDGYFYTANGMRIGSINDRQHYPRNILALITALGFTLKEGGIPGIKWEKGVEATNEVLKEMQRTLGWKYYDAE